ncbi:MAG: aspartyl protease family protein [Fimbriiglobus sp.]|nr:aspartyl protease family protein [Fimbriiglobus sp.]
MRAKLFAALIGLLAGVPAVAQDKPNLKAEPKKTDPPIVVPIEILPSRHFVVQVMLDGKGPYRFILDTGAPLTIMNSKTAKDAGLTKKGGGGGGGLLGMLGGGVNQVEVPTMEIGSVKADKTPAMVMDHPTVQAISDAFKKDHGPVEGLIGFPFFARYSMTVDYQKKELTFTPNGYKPGDYMQDMMAGIMNLEERNKPRVVKPAGVWGLELAKDKDDDKDGVTVKAVFADGPAAKAGVKAGDRLLTVDGRWTDSVGDAAVATSLVKAGKAVPVVVQRDGKEVTLTVTPAVGR